MSGSQTNMLIEVFSNTFQIKTTTLNLKAREVREKAS